MRIAALMMICMAWLIGSYDAQAHRLRLFATVEAGAVSGYAYYVGGARARGAAVLFRDTEGGELHRMQADESGAFTWKPEKPRTIRISVDAGDGHIDEITLRAERFPAGDAGIGEQPAHAPDGDQIKHGGELAALEKRLEARIEAAVARQIRPLLEAQEAAQARMRFSDIMAGIGIIIGLAGAALWAMARKPKLPGPDAT